MKLFVSKQILTWEVSASTSMTMNKSWESSYEYLEHAEKIRTITDSHNFNADIISNLKKAVDHRVKLLSQYYKLKSLGKLLGTSGSFETLREIKVIRRVMITKLIQVRNELEHKFSKAPSIELCDEYIEFVWYFLRSTDSYVRCVNLDLLLESGDDEDHFLELDVNIDDGWKLQVRGCIPQEFYTEKESSDFLELRTGSLTLGRDNFEEAGSNSGNARYYKNLKKNRHIF